MKCEHCGKNEVAFMYQSNLNGHVEKLHLCGECAEKLGYGSQLVNHSRQMMREMMGGSMLSGRFLEDFFAPVTGRTGRSRWLLEDPFEDFFREMPALRTGEATAEQSAPQKELLEKEEQSRFSRMRELNALRQEKKKAVREEDYERAAQLRDRIRALEEETNGDKESA